MTICLNSYATARRAAGRRITLAEYAEDLARDDALRRYWISGEGAAKIRWGTEGDLTRCHRLVGEKITDPAVDVWGLCQEYHIAALGEPNDPNDLHPRAHDTGPELPRGRCRLEPWTCPLSGAKDACPLRSSKRPSNQPRETGRTSCKALRMSSQANPSAAPTSRQLPPCA